ncbi:MAG: hypothetical protein HYW25_05165 [Candidatus Aenigmarchaeota archaeon]|nr:hypothetical protein [Candidatus Aenigmarchaeota archaeon]
MYPEEVASYVLLGGIGFVDLMTAAEQIHLAVLYRHHGLTKEQCRVKMIRNHESFGPISFASKGLLIATAGLWCGRKSYPTSP